MRSLGCGTNLGILNDGRQFGRNSNYSSDSSRGLSFDAKEPLHFFIEILEVVLFSDIPSRFSMMAFYIVELVPKPFRPVPISVNEENYLGHGQQRLGSCRI